MPKASWFKKATGTQLNALMHALQVRHQIDVSRYSNSIIRDVASLLSAVETDIKKQLDNPKLTEFGKGKLNSLLSGINDTFDRIATETKDEFKDFAKYEAEFQKKAINTLLPKIDISMPSATQLEAVVDFAKSSEFPKLDKWWSHLSALTQKNVKDAISLGLAEGQTGDKIVQRLLGTRANSFKDGILQETRRNAKAIVRTATTHVANQSKQLLWEQNSDLVTGWIFVATLDNRTSITCAGLSGTKWEVGKGPIPPVHVNCRSISVPMLKTWRELGIDIDEFPPGMRSTMDGLVPSDITFDAWLKTQPLKVKQDILGVTRAQLFDEGKFPLSKFIDKEGNVYTLDELSQKENIVWH